LKLHCMSPSSTLRRATLTSTRVQGLVELDALLDGVEALPPEIRVIIWRAAVPRRLRYQFREFSDREFNAIHNKIAALFLSSNQTMYREAMDIWLSENVFDFFVESRKLPSSRSSAVYVSIRRRGIWKPAFGELLLW
jgi:hypothetical protein